MKRFLELTAVIEAGTGFGLIAAPDAVVRLLLGAEISGAAIPLGRVAGIALFALGVACWISSRDGQSSTGRPLVNAMLFYNCGVALVLAASGLGIGSHSVGVALWPAVAVHAAMALWSVRIHSSRSPF
jgi:hypothetical protein